MASEGLIPNNNYWRIRSSKKREAIWDRTSPVSSVDPTILAQNVIKLEQLSLQIRDTETRINQNEQETKGLNRAIANSLDTNFIVSASERRNQIARELETSKSELDLLKGEERSAIAVVNKNRDEMAKFYVDGPYMTENSAIFWTSIGWIAIGYGAYYLINTENKAGVKFRSTMRQSPVSAAFRNA